MNKFDLLIFDCDGVLIDSEPLVCGALAVYADATRRMNEAFAQRLQVMPDMGRTASLRPTSRSTA